MDVQMYVVGETREGRLVSWELSQSLTEERMEQWWRWRWRMGGHDCEGAGCLGPELGCWSMGWDVALLEVEPK